MSKLNHLLNTFDVIFVCQKACIASYKAFNAYQDVFKRTSVFIITNNEDLPFLQVLRDYKLVKYDEYKGDLEQIAIFTSPYIIYRRNAELVKFQPAYKQDGAAFKAAELNFTQLEKKIVH